MTNDKDGAALLPCPFCGGDAVMRRDDDPGYPWYVTFEHEPDCTMYALPTDMFRSFSTEAEAIAAWNRRAALKSHGQAFDAAGVREACAKVAESELVEVFEDSPEIDTVCNSVVREIVAAIRALPIPEAPTSVEPVAVQPIATVPIGEYVLFHFDGPFNDTECPGVSVGKKCADGRYWLTAIWASSTSHHDPVGWSPIPKSARPEPDGTTPPSPAFGGGDLREALSDMCAAMEYWAGCDQGCSEDEAASEIMSSGGAWPATSYEQARKALAALPPVKQSVGFYYPIEMPLDADGNGPATIGKDAVRMTYQVWDQHCDSHGDFEFLADAIRHANKLNAALSHDQRGGSGE